MGERVEAIGAGGIGGMHQLVRKIGLVNEISAGCIC